MKYRDALNASKGCPKCCSKTLERFMKNTADTVYEPAAEPEKPSKPVDSKVVKAKKHL